MTLKKQFWALSAGALALAACSQPASEESDTVTTQTPETTSERQIVQIDPENDPRVWLEEVEGERALEWVEGQNERTFDRLRGDAPHRHGDERGDASEHREHTQ